VFPSGNSVNRRPAWLLTGFRGSVSLLSGVPHECLAIPVKRTDKRLLGYLTRQEMDALLNAHELSQWTGRRDHALLLTLYNTAARVSEMTGLQRSQVQFGTKSFVQVKGKGRKERAVPLWSSTSRTLRTWFEELNSGARYRAATAFPNARGTLRIFRLMVLCDAPKNRDLTRTMATRPL
jgi:integrase/recombinase XerD